MKQAPKDHAALPTSATPSRHNKRDCERPLVEDIRLLGRILGEKNRLASLRVFSHSVTGTGHP